MYAKMDVSRKIQIIFAALIVCSYAANETGLTALTDHDCGCPGENASYTCTAAGGVITVWGGTAFNCTGTVLNEILLRHSDFQNAIGECNNGAIRGYSIENVNNCFTSRLDVRLSADLQGRAISCFVDDGISRVTLIGTEMLIITTPSRPPPSPGMISTMVTKSNPKELIFSWNQVDYNCPTLQYNFTSPNCGSCAINNTSQAVRCTEFLASSTGITCIFTIWSFVCGNITGPQSMRSATVNLKVPDAPIVDTLPRYQDGRTQTLIELMTTFRTMAPTFISDGIDGSIEYYTITYFDSTFGSTCGTANIPASSCIGGTCIHNFDILRSSSCPPSTTIIVSVIASNVLGSGPRSNPMITDGINNLVNVNFDLNQRSIMCTFLNQPPNIMKQCSANITYGEDCDRFLGVFSGMDTGDTVTTQPLETVRGVAEYCFLVTAETSNVMVLVDGTLLSIDSQVSVPIAVVAVVIVLAIIFTLILLTVSVLVAILIKKCFEIPKTTVHVVFSVKDEPGSLAKALEVFKDCKVNILGLNTHLHHAEFDRKAGNGYKFNFVHCECRNNESAIKDFFKNKLNAKLEGDCQEHDVESITAIITVKDSPGELWNAINKIGGHKIQIIGVNTLSKRERISGYKDNHVKCHCSDETLRRVRTQLENLKSTGIIAAVNIIKCLDDDEQRKERAIEYLVKDEVGALASTLEVISNIGVNISCVNPDRFPEDVRTELKTNEGFKINFISCSIDKSTEERLFNKLRTQYDVIKVGNQVSSNKVDEDPHCTVVKVTIHNEKGSQNRILKRFHDLKINIHGINILKPAFFREEKDSYKHYHLEITATNKQEMNLKKRLLSGGLAIDIQSFDLTKCQETETDQAIDIQNFLRSHQESAETESNAELELEATPTTRGIQFLLKNEVGTLHNALEIFNELGINIIRINPAHLPREHQDEFVECSCAEDQRESLISQLKSYGATDAEEVKQAKGVDANYCVVKFSVVHDIGSIVKIFFDMGVKILKINPPHIKVHNQYVECCCTEDKQTELLISLREVVGVTDVAIITEPEKLVSTQRIEDFSDYCIIKYSVNETAGTLVRALTVFFKLNVNIIGVNMLPFDCTLLVKFRRNRVLLFATDEEVEDLKRELLITGLAFDVRSYNPEALQPGNMDGNDIALTRV